MKWACGVTSCMERATDGTLKCTLESLDSAGFDSPYVWIDGCYLSPLAGINCKCSVQVRYPAIGPWGNWWLGLNELSIREPRAEMFVMFQDDVVLCRNVRQYLDLVLDLHQPLDRYWNLYTAPSNHTMLEENNKVPGFYASNGQGKGAMALVFSRGMLPVLLSHRVLVDKPRQARHPTRRIDGSVAEALAKHAIQEYVHQPSLAQHVGLKSTLVGGPNELRAAPLFPGEEFDAMALLDKSITTTMVNFKGGVNLSNGTHSTLAGGEK